MDPYALADAALRWLMTYALHSAALCALTLLVARCWLSPGSRRSTVFRVALVGALLSSSVPSLAAPELHWLPTSGGPDALAGPLTGDTGTAIALLRDAQPSGLALASRSVLSASPSGLAEPVETAPQRWRSALLLALAGIAAVRLSQLFRSKRRFVASLQRSDLASEDAAQALGEWSAESVRITASDHLAAPLALSSREVCVPRPCWDVLNQEERRALLAHELAHIERRDPAWFTIAAALQRVFFFLPWHRTLATEFRAAAEVACDAAASRRLQSATSMARCLAKVATWSKARTAGGLIPASIPAMSSSPGELAERVQHLLGSAEQPSGPGLRASALLIAAGFTCCAPSVGVSKTAKKVSPAAPLADVDARDESIFLAVDKDRNVYARRSSAYPALEDLRVQLGGREATQELVDWLHAAVEPLPVWTERELSDAGLRGMQEHPIRHTALVIEASASTPFREVQNLMSLAGDLDVMMPDVRLRTEGETYRLPLPMDFGPQPNEAETQETLTVLITASPADGAQYSVTQRPGPALQYPVEILEEEEDADPPRQPIPVLSWNSRADAQETQRNLAQLLTSGKTIEANIDARKGTTTSEVTAAIGMLQDLGVEQIVYTGSYEP